MSLIEPLLRFFDIIEFRKKQEDRHRKKKAQPPGVPDDEDVVIPEERPPGAVATPLTCRVCGYQGGPEHKFCPRCLAETMERRR